MGETMAATNYVEITRVMAEEWLSSLSSVGSKGWSRVSGKAGVYLIHFSDLVAVSFSSSIGQGDAAMAKDKGAMYLRLVARKNPARVLNKSAIKQGKFYRTTEWKARLTKAVKTFHDVFTSSMGFYHHLAEIEDLVKYQREWTELLKSVAGYEKNAFLMDLLGKLQNGSVLSYKQEGAITFAVEEQHNKKQREEMDRLIRDDPYKPVPGLTTRPPVREQSRPPEDMRRLIQDDPYKFVPENGLISRLEKLDQIFSNPFTKSLLSQAQRRTLSPAQMAKVEEMEAKLRTRPTTPKVVKETPLSKSLDKLLDTWRDIDIETKRNVHGDSPDLEELEEVLPTITKRVMDEIAELGRRLPLGSKDRNFLRQMWDDLNRGMRDMSVDNRDTIVDIETRNPQRRASMMEIPRSPEWVDIPVSPRLVEIPVRA